MTYEYYTNCVSIQTGSPDFYRLRSIIENNVDVSRRTFLKHCPSAKQFFVEYLRYAAHPRQGLTAAADWHISYHRAKWGKQTCYFFKWSAIEYIFLPT